MVVDLECGVEQCCDNFFGARGVSFFLMIILRSSLELGALLGLMGNFTLCVWSNSLQNQLTSPCYFLLRICVDGFSMVLLMECSLCSFILFLFLGGFFHVLGSVFSDRSANSFLCL